MPGNVAWRFTLLTGLIPGALILAMMPFVPESEVWRRKRQEGTLKRPSFGELFEPTHRRTTLVTALIFACSLGAAFGAIQQLPQIVPALVQVDRTLPPPQRQRFFLERRKINVGAQVLLRAAFLSTRY